MKRYPRDTTPGASYRRYLANKGKFKWYLGMLGAFIVLWIYLAVQGVQHELLSRSPDVQTITANATRDSHECDKSGCYYVAYGHYTINSTYEDNVKLGKWSYPTMGEVGIRVNPAQPRFAMDLYQTSYIAQIIIPSAAALLFAGWGGLLFWLFKRRGKRVTQALSDDPSLLQ